MLKFRPRKADGAGRSRPARAPSLGIAGANQCALILPPSGKIRKMDLADHAGFCNKLKAQA